MFAPNGIDFRWFQAFEMPPERAALETRGDRDALGDRLERRVINVFVVGSLRDVDDGKSYRMGVCWQSTRDASRRYVIVASSARPSVLAHELGHFFGNGHTTVVDNLMSYERGGGVVFLSAEQKSRIAEVATRFATTGFLDVLGPPRAFH